MPLELLKPLAQREKNIPLPQAAGLSAIAEALPLPNKFAVPQLACSPLTAIVSTATLAT